MFSLNLLIKLLIIISYINFVNCNIINIGNCESPRWGVCKYNKMLFGSKCCDYKDYRR